MTIVYSLVSVGTNVLAEFAATNASGNFPTVTRVLLGKIDPAAGDARMTIVYDNYVFHYVVEHQVIYLCMSDELNKYRVPYAFLNDVKDRFLAQYGSEAPLHAMAFCYNTEFAPVLQERMDHYNNPDSERSIDNIGAVKNQIDEVKQNMVQNISNLLERGERLELLVEKTDNLNQQAFRFEASGRSLRRAMYWRQMRCYAGVGASVIVLIFFAFASFCGGLDFAHCKK